ncbi:MAG: hypothetical protein WA624_17290 [Methylocella sp.]
MSTVTMWRFFLSFLLTAIWTDYGYAQAIVERSEIEHFVQTADGKPHFCGIDFTILFSDYVTSSNGRLATARGSLSFKEQKGDLVLFLKVGGMDFASPGQPPTKFAVATASLIAGGTTYFVANQIPCEDKNMFCGIFWLPASAEIYSKILSERTVTLNFNRTTGSLDVQVPISSVGSPQDAKNQLAFDACMGTILSQARANNAR